MLLDGCVNESGHFEYYVPSSATGGGIHAAGSIEQRPVRRRHGGAALQTVAESREQPAAKTAATCTGGSSSRPELNRQLEILFPVRRAVERAVLRVRRAVDEDAFPFSDDLIVS